MLTRKHEYEKMARVEHELWWYRTLHDLVLKAIVTNIGDDKRVKIIDAGCGTGGLMDYLRLRKFENISGFDLSPYAVELSNERGLDVICDNILNIADHHSPGSADVIVSNDTFYFLSREERRVATENFYKTLRPGGIVILNLPSLNAFRGMHDVSVGIGYRFDKGDIDQIFDRGHFALVKANYWNFTLSPAIYVARSLQRRQLRKHPAIESHSDITVPSSPINNALYLLNKLENSLLPWKPWGSSLLVVMKKKQ